MKNETSEGPIEAVVILNEGKPSPNVLFEMGMALSQGKRLMPVILSEHAGISVLADLFNMQAMKTKEAGLVAKEMVNASEGEL